MNFKGVQTLWEKYGKFTKNYIDLIFTNVNLVGHTYIQEYDVSIHVL
jgi:hypothetical protein